MGKERKSVLISRGFAIFYVVQGGALGTLVLSEDGLSLLVRWLIVVAWITGSLFALKRVRQSFP